MNTNREGHKKMLFVICLLIPAINGLAYIGVRNMIVYRCNQTPLNIVIPQDIPYINENIPTLSVNHTLHARYSTVRCVGLSVLSDPNRTYTLGFLGEDDVVPLVNPTSRGTIDTSWILQIPQPTKFTVEVVFSISRRVLPTSRYRLFDDGIVRVSYVIGTVSAFCSTVRYIEMTDETTTFVLDFNQARKELGVTITPDTPIHLFWTRDTSTSISKICLNLVGMSTPSCAYFGNDSGPLTLIYDPETISTTPPFQMFTLYLQAMFESTLTDDQIDFLDQHLPHFEHHPVPRSLIVSTDERLKFNSVKPFLL